MVGVRGARASARREPAAEADAEAEAGAGPTKAEAGSPRAVRPRRRGEGRSPRSSRGQGRVESVVCGAAGGRGGQSREEVDKAYARAERWRVSAVPAHEGARGLRGRTRVRARALQDERVRGKGEGGEGGRVRGRRTKDEGQTEHKRGRRRRREGRRWRGAQRRCEGIGNQPDRQTTASCRSEARGEPTSDAAG